MNTNHRQRWIVVDDDWQVLQLSAYILRDMDAAEICVCRNAREAIDAFALDPGSVGLLVTDWNMPGMDGIELSRRLHACAPKMPIVMMTGREWNLDSAAAARVGVRAVIAKPFSIDRVQKTIRDVLELRAPDIAESLAAFLLAA